MIEPEQPPAPPEVVAARMASVDLGSALGPFSDTGLLAAGKVNLIALDPIVDRLGGRWALRRDQVHEHVDRTLQRRLGATGYHIRASETDFLICQPDLGRFSGQAAALQMLREILTHFIGDSALADDCVLQVTDISATEIACARVRISEVEKGERDERDASVRTPPDCVADRWTPFVASDGRRLSVTGDLAPVVELRSFGRIGCRMTRQVIDLGSGETLTAAMVRVLPQADIRRIDLATVAHGVDRLRAMQGSGRQPSLIVPVSFVSLSSQRSRAEIGRLLLSIRSLVEKGVICEIRDVEGVPQCALIQVVALIRPYCLFVVAHLAAGPMTAATLAHFQRSGLQGLSVECPQSLSDAALLSWMEVTVRAVRQVVRSSLMYRVASARHAAFAAQLGATHASLEP